MENSSSSSSFSSLIPPNLSFLLSNFNSLITVKLDSNNFPIWKNQIQNVLRATKLLEFVTGSTSSPQPEIIDSSGKSITNPEFAKWKTIDAHLLSFITATLSPPVFCSVLHLQTCSQIWNALEKRYTSLSRSHIHQLKNKLQTVSKRGLSMEEYLTQIKEISTQLSLASSSVDDEDLVLLTLNGLPDEYDALKTAIRARVESITIDDLSSLLCSEAIHIENKTKAALGTDATVAYSVKKSNESSSFRGSSSNCRGGHSFCGGRERRSQGGRYTRGSRGRFGQGNQGHYKCQICGGYSHIAIDCWFRMDLNY